MSENNEIKEPLNKNYKVPKLRFPEFNDNWEENILSSYAYIISGGTPDTTNQKYWNGEINWFTPTEIGIEKYVSESQRKITSLGLSKSSAKLINANSILLTSRATIGAISINKKDCSTNQGFQSLIPNGINLNYLYYLISTRKFQNKLFIHSSKSTFLEISHKEISKLKINVPINKYEQEKIGLFFDLIDNKIQIIKNKIDILKKYKEGVFLGTRKCSKKIALKTILSEVNIKTKYNNQYEILSSTAIGLFSQKEYFKHQVASENNVGYKVIKKGQLLFSPQNLWLGNINLNNDFEIGIVSPSYKIYDIDNLINSSWLISMLKSQNMLYKYKQISEQGASVVRRNLDLSQFLEITLDIPDNQIQIGITLEAIDKKINALSILLMNLKNLKMHLLNEMFI